MMGAYFLTYDIISSGIKTSAFSQDGKLLAHAYRPLVQHFSGNTAQEPVEAWLSGFEETPREVAGQTSLQNLGAIAFTSTASPALKTPPTPASESSIGSRSAGRRSMKRHTR